MINQINFRSRPHETRSKVPQIINFITVQLQQIVTKYIRYPSLFFILLKKQFRKNKQVDINLFNCLSLLIRSQKEVLNERIHEILPILFSTGISEPLNRVGKI